MVWSASAATVLPGVYAPVTFTTATTLASGETLVELPEVRAPLKLYAAPPRTLTVKCYRVFRCNASGVRLDKEVPVLDIATFHTALDAIFRRQTAITVTASDGGEVNWIPADDIDGDGRIDYRTDAQKFLNLRDASGANYCIFLCQPGAWGTMSLSWVTGSGMGKGAFALPEERLSYSDVGHHKSLAHEIGHLMGLDHPFAHGNLLTGTRTIPCNSDGRLMGYGEEHQIINAEVQRILAVIPAPAP